MVDENESLGSMPSYATGVLSDEELEAIRAEARAKVQEERMAQLRKDAMRDALAAEREAQGVLQRSKEPQVSIRLELPDSVTPFPAIVIDGRAYWENTTYQVPESTAIQLFHMQADQWRQDDRQRGHFLDFRRKKPQAITGRGMVSGPPLVHIGR
jgi:hypothetical protein